MTDPKPYLLDDKYLLDDASSPCRCRLDETDRDAFGNGLPVPKRYQGNEGAYMAIGIYGQPISVNPVRLALTRGDPALARRNSSE